MSHERHADVDFVRDTSAEALSFVYEIQRKRPVGQKLGLFETVKAGIRLRYPEADEREVFLRAVASRVSRELMIRAYILLRSAWLSLQRPAGHAGHGPENATFLKPSRKRKRLVWPLFWGSR
jgi:hypothetical protein